MNTIRIETTLDSETLYLPQLKPLMGKSVEIVVQEIASPSVLPATQDPMSVEIAVLGLADYDFDAWRASRELEIEQTNGKAS
jgi:hypothetical protein